MPKDLIDKMHSAKNYCSGIASVRQLEFALFDFLLYMEYDASKKEYVESQLKHARERAAVMIYPEWNRFANSFSHIFGGGYAAGYYSYKWAEVLAADAASVFIEKGMLNRKLGEKFKDEILSRGGSRSAMENFVAFMGRKPTTDALLRRDGFIE